MFGLSVWQNIDDRFQTRPWHKSAGRRARLTSTNMKGATVLIADSPEPFGSSIDAEVTSDHVAVVLVPVELPMPVGSPILLI